jgi:hypothetical protein
MPYDPARDLYASNSGPNKRGRFWSAPLTASGTEFAIYPKAITVFVPSGTAGPHLSMVTDVGDTPLPFTMPEGVITLIDHCVVRAVTAITANVVVRRVDD